MRGKRSFDAQLAALDGLRHEPADAPRRIEALRSALGSRNNYIVSKAAALVREFRLAELMPELLAAFDRFFIDPIKSDPQCWAKNAISRALAELDCQQADVFVRGMRHIQLEPVWGGSADTAGSLRAACGMALVQCRSLPDHELLANLIGLLADKDKSVRAEGARAISQAGSHPAALLLRLRAVLADDEPEVLGACFSGILSIEGAAAILWLSRFLERADDVAAEAALAIAQDRSPEAFRALRHCFDSIGDGGLDSGRTARRSHARQTVDVRVDDEGIQSLIRARGTDDGAWFRSVLLAAIALTRQEDAQTFLFDLVQTESADAEAAVEAILRSGPPPEVVNRLEEAVRDTPRLARAFATHRPKTS